MVAIAKDGSGVSLAEHELVGGFSEVGEFLTFLGC
jgi:hypothetical protein